MKQNITVKQLKNLNSDEKVCKLNTLMNHEWDLSEEELKQYSWNQILEDTANYCTIGRLIEILNNTPRVSTKDDSIYITIDRTLNACFMGHKKNEEDFISYNDVGLCDLLWKAVKELL